MTQYALVCPECDHYLSGQRCLAFSGRIPKEILNGSNDHRKPVEGDHGLRFEQRKEP